MAKKSLLLTIIILSIIKTTWAFDFSAVCSSGQTLYYKITDATNHYVKTTYPGGASTPWIGYPEPTGNMGIPSSVMFNGISYSVKAIGSNSFSGCTNITSVTIPSSVSTIEDYSFYECIGLISMNLGSSVSSIGIRAFQSCTGLSSVSFSNSLTTIGHEAFRYSGISSLNLPSSVIHVDDWAFHSTPWFNNQPDGVVYTGLVAYSYKGTMSSNTSITIQPGTKVLADGSFREQAGLTSVSLPSSLIVIGNESFFGCGGLTTITIPSSVAYIGDKAFAQCGTLQTVNYNAQNCTYAGSSGATVFSGSSSINTLNIQNGVISIPEYVFFDCYQLTNVQIPNSVVSIHDNAFCGCSGLSSITIGRNVTFLGGSVFGGCTGLTTINYNAINCSNGSSSPFPSSPTTLNIGNEVQTIPMNMFSGCSNITTLTIPNSVTSIGVGAFFYCTGATSLSIGNSLQSIPEQAFYGCSGLSSVTIPNTVTTIGDYAFQYCTGMTSLQIGNGVSSIGEGAFAGCSSLSSLSMGNSVSSIGDDAFSFCSSLASVTIPASVSSMAANAFSFCNSIATVNYNAINCTNSEATAFFSGNSITSFTIGNGVVSIPRSLIMNCPNLTSQLIIPNTVTSIGGMAFSYCGFSGKLTIPSSVSSIANTAFMYCTGLTEIEVLSETPPSCGSTAFAGCYEIPLIVPCGCVPAYQNAQGWSNFTNIQQTSGCGYQIDASANPSVGGTVQGAGIYNPSQTCTLSALPNTGFSFVNWTENGSQVSTNQTYSFSVTRDRTLVANFQNAPSTYTISLSANPSSGGTVSGAGAYNQGQSCTVTAIANNGYNFNNWTENGNVVSNNASYTFTVNGNRNLIANFTANPIYTISTSSNPTSGGNTSGGGSFQQGQTCTVIASPNNNYAFTNWTENGTQVSSNPSYSFSVTGNRTLIANFSYSPNQYVINATADPSYGGLVSGTGSYDQGQTCTLIATPSPNYDFVNWTEGGNVVSNDATYSFTVNGNRTLVAHFESQVFTINISSNPSDGGTVYGGGDYSAGITCHIIAIPNSGFTFQNWMENGVVVSSDPDYSFVVTGNRDVVANFINYDGIAETGNLISVYPNPANSKVYVKGVHLKKIEVFNMMGVLSISEELLGDQAEIHLQHLSAGIYCMRIHTEEGTYIRFMAKD